MERDEIEDTLREIEEMTTSPGDEHYERLTAVERLRHLLRDGDIGTAVIVGRELAHKFPDDVTLGVLTRVLSDKLRSVGPTKRIRLPRTPTK